MGWAIGGGALCGACVLLGGIGFFHLHCGSNFVCLGLPPRRSLCQWSLSKTLSLSSDEAPADTHPPPQQRRLSLPLSLCRRPQVICPLPNLTPTTFRKICSTAFFRCILAGCPIPCLFALAKQAPAGHLSPAKPHPSSLAVCIEVRCVGKFLDCRDSRHAVAPQDRSGAVR